MVQSKSHGEERIGKIKVSNEWLGRLVRSQIVSGISSRYIYFECGTLGKMPCRILTCQRPPGLYYCSALIAEHLDSCERHDTVLQIYASAGCKNPILRTTSMKSVIGTCSSSFESPAISKLLFFSSLQLVIRIIICGSQSRLFFPERKRRHLPLRSDVFPPVDHIHSYVVTL